MNEVTFARTFERGPHDGAMIDFGRMKIECFLPYEDDEGGLPFLPIASELTRPMLRAILGVSDAFLNEHGGDLPGRLPCWCLCVSTLPFMRDCYFDPEFLFPTRTAARAARRERHFCRKRHPRPPRPSKRGRRRR